MNGVPDWSRRDYDEMIASSLSGSVVGGGVGYIWRGPFAIVPGMMTYALLGGMGQAVYTRLRHWRQEAALNKRGYESVTYRDILAGKVENNWGQIDPFQMLFSWVYQVNSRLGNKLARLSMLLIGLHRLLMLLIWSTGTN
jgi:hypothetical protein